MHMKERAAYRCKSKRCRNFSSSRLPRIRSAAIRKRNDVQSSDDTDKSRSRASSTNRGSARFQKPQSCGTQGRPRTSQRHEDCSNFMSETLLSVAAKLEKVFNSSGAPNHKVKRVYVIKLDDRSRDVSKCHTRFKRILSKKKPGKGENARAMNTASRTSRSPKRERCRSTASDEGMTRSLSTNDRSGDAPDTSPDQSLDDDLEKKHDATDVKNSALWHKLQPERGKPRGFHIEKQSMENSIRKPPHYKVISRRSTREKANPGHAPKRPKADQIADIFGAILKEIESLSGPKGRARSPKKKTLSEIIESEQSLVSADYTIPPSMINKEAVDVLQALIDYKRKPRKATDGRKASRSSQRSGSISRPFSSMEWYGLRQPLNYPAEIIREPEINMAASSSSNGPICRICHERLGTLVRPCRCRGSMAYVHVECLQMWLTEKNIDYCELCHYKFRVIHVPEYRLVPSIGFWYKFAATNEQRKRILIDLTLAVILLPVLIFITFFARSCSAEYPADETDDENMEYEDNWSALAWMLLVYGFRLLTFLLNMFYVGAVFVRINHHLAAWLSWYVNKNVTVVLEDRHPGSVWSAGTGDD